MERVCSGDLFDLAAVHSAGPSWSWVDWILLLYWVREGAGVTHADQILVTHAYQILLNPYGIRTLCEH